jgi:hypothetical protein
MVLIVHYWGAQGEVADLAAQELASEAKVTEAREDASSPRAQLAER